MKPGYGPRRACTITTVHPKTRKIEAALKDQTVVQIAVFDTREFFAWPKVGENWIIRQANGIWTLDRRADNTDDLKINDLEPGHGKIAADVVKTPTGKSVVITDDAKAEGHSVLSYIDDKWQPNADLQIKSLSVSEKVVFGAGVEISTISSSGVGQEASLNLIETVGAKYITLNGGKGTINLSAANPEDPDSVELAKKSSVIFDNNGLIQFSKQGTIDFKSASFIYLNSSASENGTSDVAGSIFVGTLAPSPVASINFYKNPKKIEIKDSLFVDSDVEITGTLKVNTTNVTNVIGQTVTGTDYVLAKNDLYVGTSSSTNTIHLNGLDGSARFNGIVTASGGVDTNGGNIHSDAGVIYTTGGVDATGGNVRADHFYIGSGTGNPLATQLWTQNLTGYDSDNNNWIVVRWTITPSNFNVIYFEQIWPVNSTQGTLSAGQAKTIYSNQELPSIIPNNSILPLSSAFSGASGNGWVYTSAVGYEEAGNHQIKIAIINSTANDRVGTGYVKVFGWKFG